jgi:hypothetical protein
VIRGEQGDDGHLPLHSPSVELTVTTMLEAYVLSRRKAARLTSLTI